jgi:hypothetical protein
MIEEKHDQVLLCQVNCQCGRTFLISFKADGN